MSGQDPKLLATVAAYPGAMDAVAYAELYVDVPCAGGFGPMELIRHTGISPAVAVVAVRLCMEEDADCRKDETLAAAIRQTRHPDFLRYMAGKLGAV